ncbi:hypothetical protein [Streptomyces sp. SID13031]|uniref:hypothetical protein n=1 Tax=Streptomyces sp. SID13031 TaxID=2706046 RepID=UPI0013CA3419|nr:hypothetical protein [Streptomyces sp. SID13031]NEA31075.1 hypothetical protein [Streptomyces sp. SID13031]
MTVLAELTADFPWGVLLVTDAESSEQIPEWSSPREQVASALTALVVRVRHADEGPVTVRVLNGSEEARGVRIYEGSLSVPSGLLRVSDAVGSEAVEVSLAAGLSRLTIHADEPSEATFIEVVLGGS